MRLRSAIALAAASVAALGLTVPATGLAAGGPDIAYVANPPHRLAVGLTPASAAAAASDQTSCIQKYGLNCYGPQDIRQAYDVPAAYTGAGQTIVIVDAFGSPTIRKDLATFDAAFGLPAPTLNIIYPDGAPTYQATANQVGWAEETTLDVEWSHAIAPGATIDLVVAPTNYGNALNTAEGYAVEHHLGNVMSMSFGAPEAAFRGNNGQYRQAVAIDAQAVREGMSVFASAGDNGAGNGFSTPNALFPASDPNVTAVGGTDLFTNANGGYGSETVWNDSDPALCPYGCSQGVFGATGGAPSALFSAPSYQAGVNGMAARTTADVAYNASVYTGVLVYMSFPGVPAGFYFFGGTSEGAPQWAAIAALADQAAGHALGALNPLLYAIAASPTAYAADFHDVTVGQNGLGGPGFSAGTGYDLPTGLGSPDVANLIKSLVQAAG